MTTLTFPLPTDAIQQFCRRWKIRELALFGSALRPDFRPDSDVDVLVTFHDDADWGLLDHMQMQQDLAAAAPSHRPGEQTCLGTASLLGAP